MPEIKAVVFDLDGVLVGACEWHYTALNMAMEKNGIAPIRREDHETIYNGLPTRKKLAMMGLAPHQIEAINQDKQALTLEAIRLHGKPDSTKQELLGYLKDRGVKIGCYTNSIRQTALAMLDVVGVTKYLDCLLTNEDVVNPKPDPEGYIKMCEFLQVRLDETIIFEDSPHGIMAASKAHPMFVWVVNGPHDVTLSNFLTLTETKD